MPSWALAWALLVIPAPQSDDTRFDRIHLRNGNFLDGRIVKSSASEIVLRLKVGEMTVRRDLIDRIEQVSMRSLTEESKAPPPPPPPPASRPGPRPAGEERVPAAGAPSLPAETDVQKTAVAVLDELRRADLESRPAIVGKLLPLGEEGAVFLATHLPKLDAPTMPYVGAFLARAKEPKTAPILAGHLKHAKPAVRAVSALAVGGLGASAPVAELLPLLGDADLGVRAAALAAMREIAPREAFGPVARLVTDPALQVRTQAVEALFEIAQKHDLGADVSQVLIPHLDRSAGSSRATVAGALGRAGDKVAWSSLTPLLRDDSAEVRAAAAQALETLAAPEAGDAILGGIVAERDKKVRVRLAAAAEKLMLRDAGKPMIAWLDEDDAEVKGAALAALRKISGRNFGPDRKTWESYWQTSPPK